MTAVRTERVVKSLVTADPEFTQLCEVLYGAVDPDEISAEVFGKRGPQEKDPMSEEEIRRRRLKRISQASNIVGLTAGAAAIGSTLRDERLDPEHNPNAGRVARALSATGKKIPKPISNLSGSGKTKLASTMAVGAAALQGGNVAGDLAVSQALKEPKKKPVAKASPTDMDEAVRRSLRPTTTAPPSRSRQAGRTPRGRQRTPTRAQTIPSYTGVVTSAGGNSNRQSPRVAQARTAAASKPKTAPPVGARPARPKRSTAPAAPAVPATPNTTKAPRQGFLARRRSKKNANIAQQIHESNPAKKLQPLPYTAPTPIDDKIAQETYRATGRRITNGRTAMAGAGVLGAGYLAGKRKKSNTYSDPYVYKAAPEMTFEGEFSKFDEDKRTAFGWASVVEKDGIPIVDRQGDYISAEDIEVAAYDYVLKSRKGGDMHRRITSELGEDAPHHVADLIESVVFTKEKIEKMGLPDNFPIGWWIGMKVHDDDTWDLVKKGERKGFSIHGKGKRVEKSIDEIVRY